MQWLEQEQVNANELADKLEQGHWEGGTREQAATMLRQQQAEIEELKTCLIVEQEHNELMVEDRSKYEALAHAGGVEVGKELKTLTDEEIIEIWSGMETDTGEQNIIFARAILRKAQEKCTK